jgi:outer membrane beta-barrel protein
MDRRLHALLLSAAAAVGILAAADPACAEDPVGASAGTPQVVEPRVQRRDVKAPAIDTENFEAGLFVGTVSIEDFGSSFLYGARIAYHFTEDVFAEATLGSAKAGNTSYEDLSGSAQLLTDSERQYTYYDLALGWNALPGESFFGSHRAMPSAVYFTLGAGSTRFGGDDHFTVTLGSGYRLLVNDWLAAHLDVRNQMFDSDLLGEDKLTQNLQFSIGLTAFF